jgi:uncharacterized membrane protein
MPKTPDIPLLVESDEAEFLDSGVPSTVHVLKHPLHPLIVTFPIAFYSRIFFIGLLAIRFGRMDLSGS